MAGALNINGYNVGTDISLIISDEFGDVFPADVLGHVMEFNSRSEDTLLKVSPISNGGIPIYQTLWAGHSGKLSFTRVNGALASMIISMMNAYHQAGIIPQWAIQAGVLNRNGQVDQYLWQGLQWSKPDLGDFRHEKEVTMSLDFSASVLNITGGALPFLSKFPVF